MIFYLGLHKPWHAAVLPRAFMSVNVLRRRRKPVDCPDVIVDSGAFTELAQYGRYRHSVADYAADLRLHGFGIKKTALEDEGVRALLFSADSIAWSYSARRQGRNQNSVAEAQAYGAAIESVLARPTKPWQPSLV